MHIVAIAWLYVTLMMAITEKNLTAGVLTFGFYGLAPCALFLWLASTRRRRRAKQRQSGAAHSRAHEVVHQPNGADTRSDQ